MKKKSGVREGARGRRKGWVGGMGVKGGVGRTKKKAYEVSDNSAGGERKM